MPVRSFRPARTTGQPDNNDCPPRFSENERLRATLHDGRFFRKGSYACGSAEIVRLVRGQKGRSCIWRRFCDDTGSRALSGNHHNFTRGNLLSPF